MSVLLRSVAKHIVMFLVLLMGLYQPAQAVIEPQPLAMDDRIRSILYDPNSVFKFTGHYGFQSSILFETDEKIETISMGDSIAWQITPAVNRIFLKPIETDADTNMTVLTDKRTYHFELHAREPESIRDKEMIFAMRFVYPRSNRFVNRRTVEVPITEKVLQNPQAFNFNYTLSGEGRISPQRIFDDGKFTYFEFPVGAPDFPAIFQVDAYGNEALVNFRVRDNIIVVERIASAYTLRHGEDHVCVFNEQRPMQNRAEAVKKEAPEPSPYDDKRWGGRDAK